MLSTGQAEEFEHPFIVYRPILNSGNVEFNEWNRWDPKDVMCISMPRQQMQRSSRAVQIFAVQYDADTCQARVEL
jgi:hypothetical protein